MEKKEFSDSHSQPQQVPTPSSEAPLSGQPTEGISEKAAMNERSERPTAAEGGEVEGIEADSIDVEGIDSLEGSSEGIRVDRTVFEEGELIDSIGFAPHGDDDLLTDSDGSDADLAFEDLSAESLQEEEDAPKIVRKKTVRHEGGGMIKGFSAAIIYLLIVVFAGVVSALMIISFANDIFAFEKDDAVYELTIENADMSLKELSEYLHEEGIIRYPFIFRLYVGLKEDGKIELNEGTFSISPSYNYDKILTCLNPPPVREEITITFKEGLTIDDIIDIFVENGIGTRSGFVKAIEEYDFDYWFLEGLEMSEDRFYRLEGYLYPDTYRFFSDSSEVAALTKMLDNFDRKVPDTYRERCEELGLTLDQAVILASMIESECARINDLEYVSAVFHNRLKSSTFDGKLDSDATIQYYLRHTTGERKPELTAEDLAIDSPYNSRLYKGLPPGAICNPSLNALMAAVYPNTECGYYYFVAQANGYNLYAKTLAQHNQNVEQVRRENEANN